VQEQAQRNLEEVEDDYPDLRLLSCSSDLAVYRGTVTLNASYQYHAHVIDEFEVEIKFPLNGSRIVPTAKETGGKIPRRSEFHINGDGTMCLGAPLEVRRKFFLDRSLKSFIDKQVIHFLYGCTIKLRYNYWPYEELAHGGQGIIEYYQKLLDVETDLAVIEMLKLLSEKKIQNNLLCVCGSKKSFKKCHGDKVQKLKHEQTKEEFFSDFIESVKAYVESGKILPPHILGI